MILPSVTVIPSEQFDYDSKTKSFAQEVSCLRGYDLMSRIYDDSIDEGFGIISEVTGKTVYFGFVGVDKNDGEITAWKFRSISPIKSTYMNVMVFND